MLKSVASVIWKPYTCLFVPTLLSDTRWCVYKFLHTTTPMAVMDKDHPHKRSLDKDEKFTKIIQHDPHLSLSDPTDARLGLIFPTPETHSHLINGVPFKELPIIHIKTTPNNTIINVTKYSGGTIVSGSAGAEGFHNAKKGTNIAAQATGIAVGEKAFKIGVQDVRIVVKGIGAGRMPSIKGLQMAGLNIVSITDATPINFLCNRPPKRRRI